MKRAKYILSSLLVLSFLVMVGCNQSSSPVDSARSMPNATSSNHYIIVLKDASGNSLQSTGAARAEVMSFISNVGIAPSAVGHVYDAVVKGFSADLSQSQLDQLNKDGRVAYVEKDEIFTVVDPVINIYEDHHKNKDNTGGDVGIESQTIPWGITRVGGPSTATSFHKAWIVDTGIDLTHPDLNVYTPQCTTFVRTGSDATTANDLNGHGSHVSGIIAAKNNTVGVVGVAPGAQLVAVKVLNSQGSGYTSDIVAGLNYVYKTASSGDVVNCSFGGGASTTIDNAVKQFATRNGNGGTYVSICIAAGNSSANAANTSPARVNGTGIYTISAFGSGDIFAYFSNYGNPPIDYSAPGVSIYSTYKNGGYATLSGTSMATPHVCGIILGREASSNSSVPATSGTVKNDKDNTPDPIAHL